MILTRAVCGPQLGEMARRGKGIHPEDIAAGERALGGYASKYPDMHPEMWQQNVSAQEWAARQEDGMARHGEYPVQLVYKSQCGWDSLWWQGKQRQYFRFSDSGPRYLQFLPASGAAEPSRKPPGSRPRAPHAAEHPPGPRRRELAGGGLLLPRRLPDEHAQPPERHGRLPRPHHRLVLVWPPFGRMSCPSSPLAVPDFSGSATAACVAHTS